MVRIRAAVAELLSRAARWIQRLAAALRDPLLAAAPAAVPPLPAAGGGKLSARSAWSDREALAAAVGAWHCRLLAGGSPAPLGAHGRERQTLRSRVWVCFVDRDGRRLSPVAVSRCWTTLLRAVASDPQRPKEQAAQAVTIGWPTLREAKICVAAARCEWPATLLE